MLAALQALGATVADDGDWHVTGSVAGARGDTAVSVGNAGTAARFLPALAALRSGVTAFTGDPRMSERPLSPLVAALRALGAEVDGEAVPLRVLGRGSLRGGAVTVDASASSQLVSGLLLAGPLMDDGLVLRHEGPPVPSRPHLDMTVAMMRAFGATVAADGDTWTVAPGGYRPHDVEVEPDLSNAAPFLAAAVVTGGTVRVPGWPVTTDQPGAALPALLERAGARWTLDGAGLTLRGPAAVAAFDVDLRHAGEVAPVLAAVACVATGPCALRGIGHLRAQETDRLAALRTELAAHGARVADTADSLTVTPGPLRPGPFATYDDHRLVHAAAVLGLAVEVDVLGAETVGKTMPDFADRWAAMLG